MTCIQEQNQRYYDAESAIYDSNRYSSRRGRRVEEFHKRVLDELLVPDLPTGAKILELGCGTGRLLPHLLAHGFRLSGLDMSDGMLRAARERIASYERTEALSVDLRLGNALETPYSNGAFDAVYSILVINLIPNYRDVMCEVSRILRPDGVFIFNVPNLASVYFLGGVYVNVRGRSVSANEAGYRYSHWFLPREWRTALGKAGFKVSKVVGQPPYVKVIDNAAPLDATGIRLLLSKSLYIKAYRKAGALARDR